MTNIQKQWAELLLLFLVLPVGLILPLSPIFLVLCALTAVIWCFMLMYKEGVLSKQHLFAIPKETKWRPILTRIGLFLVASTLMVWWFLPEKLFFVVKENPGLWLGISLFYTVVSVYPQELIYRHFFYWRYSHLLSPGLFLALNAILFSLAHTIFMNSLVFALTLAGGFLFANTYRKTQSLMVTSIEHAVYGLWLYTVGLGEMLAFPGP